MVFQKLLLSAIPRGWGRYGGRLMTGGQFQYINKGFNMGMSERSILNAINKLRPSGMARLTQNAVGEAINEVRNSREKASRWTKVNKSKRPTNNLYARSGRNLKRRYLIRGSWTRTDADGVQHRIYSNISTSKRWTREEIEQELRTRQEDITERYNYAKPSEIQIEAAFYRPNQPRSGA